MSGSTYLKLVIFLILFASFPVSYAIDFSHLNTYKSHDTGGNIYFGSDFTADLLNHSNGQIRFENFLMINAPAWSGIGFRCPANAEMTVTGVSGLQINIICDTIGQKTYELYVGSKGIPDVLIGVDFAIYFNNTVYFNATGMALTVFRWNGSTVDVSVKNSMNQPVTNAYVQLINSGLPVANGFVNSSGYYRSIVAIGNYTINASAMGYAPYSFNYTLLNSYNLVEVTLETYEEATVFNIELLIFVALGSILMAWGYRTEKIQEKMLAYGFSMIAWIATIGQWVVTHIDQPNLMLLIVFMAPFMMSFAWFMQALGGYVDRGTGKHDPFEDF